jgi:hypothetical protein
MGHIYHIRERLGNELFVNRKFKKRESRMAPFDRPFDKLKASSGQAHTSKEHEVQFAAERTEEDKRNNSYGTTEARGKSKLLNRPFDTLRASSDAKSAKAASGRSHFPSTKDNDERQTRNNPAGIEPLQLLFS